SKLSNLTSLDLEANQLSTLPESISKLSNLTSLNLRANQLSTLPESISKLSNLTSLILSENQIKKIPSWLAEKKVEIRIGETPWDSNGINLYGNPIEEPPLEVVRQGNQAILNYYSQIATQGKDYLYEAKMLIVGEGGAGKTTLAHKIQDNNCPLPTIDDRTRGITINTHSFSVPAQNQTENRPFQLNVWDFGGQEIYHATHRFFLSKRSLYVLVADNRKDDTDFNYWLNIIELFAGDSPVMIVLNEKDDLQRKINASEIRSRYPESLKEILPVNFKTREETDSDKRQQRLKLIGQLISDIEHNAAQLPHIGEAVPALWVNIRQAIENDTRNYIYSEEFFQICHDRGITNDLDIATLLGYFHDLGIVLHFADNPLLRDRVILKPAWATNAVYRIFDNDLINAKQGRFTRTDCSTLWSDIQYKHMHDVLIALMKNFLLVYEIGNTGNLIAPQMLPKDTPKDIPKYKQDDTNNSLMQFRYDLFMPKGILWQFIVTMYRYIQNHDYVWCNGVILERNGTSAEIKENLSDRRIYLRFSGTSIAEFRAIIADRLDEISQSYHKLKYDKMVPCSCSICRSSSKPHFFKFSVLKKRQKKGKKHTIECEISEEDVSLNLLLEGFERPRITEEPPESITQDRTPSSTIHIHSGSGTVIGIGRDNQNLVDVNMEGDRNKNIEGDYIQGDTVDHSQVDKSDRSRNFQVGDVGGDFNPTNSPIMSDDAQITASTDSETAKKKLNWGLIVSVAAIAISVCVGGLFNKEIREFLNLNAPLETPEEGEKTPTN
nr:COR domain-containing protein [Xenococcus sp. MO_188.B8]